MDVLVEIIVAILRGLFGEPEKPADMGRNQRRRPQNQPDRGPYRYGDEGGEPTLEEMLRDVRGGNAAPPPPQEPPRQQRPPKRQRAQREAPPVESQPETQRSRLSEETLPSQNTAEGLPEIQHLEHVLPRAPVEHVETVQTVGAPPPPPAPPPSAGSPRKSAATPANPVAKPQMSSLLDAIRRAPAAEKRRAAREAILVYEVFGPPRARRPQVRDAVVPRRPPANPEPAPVAPQKST